MNTNSKKTTQENETMTSRQAVNSILQKLEKNGHQLSDLVLIHKGLENGVSDPTSQVKEAYRVVHHRSASTKASEILAEGKFKCKKNTSRGGDPESIESGHALKLMHDGEYLAIVIDTKNCFQKSIIQPGILFLPKHLTASKKTVKEAV